jgi:thioredoxin reductase
MRHPPGAEEAGVEVRRARVVDARGEDGAFEITLEEGAEIRKLGARKIVLATGMADELPDVPGFRELWGRGVYHCPYCHGWEVRDRPLAVLASGEEVVARAVLLRNWSRDLIALTDGPAGLDEAARGRLEALRIGLKEEAIRSSGSFSRMGLRSSATLSSTRRRSASVRDSPQLWAARPKR